MIKSGHEFMTSLLGKVVVDDVDMRHRVAVLTINGYTFGPETLKELRKFLKKLQKQLEAAESN